METLDALGLPLSGADAGSLEFYEKGLGELQRFAGDPVGSVDAAIALRPDFVMAHVLKGYLFGLSTDAEAMPTVQACHAAAQALPATERERGHVAALGALAAGEWHRAGELLLAVSAQHPRDVLALQAGHQVDFFTGNATLLRDRIARALPAWSDPMPGSHAVHAAYAFGLEENGDYAVAERHGRHAVALEPRDGWGQHAVAHVMEMQCRQSDGIAWMRGNEAGWTGDSFLQVHNWWHLALFHYDLGDVDAVLALYDGHLAGVGPTLALNLVDASALLWRLHLGGVDVGDRWVGLADCWAPKAKAGNYAFNDMHAMMAFVGAGRDDSARDLLATQREAVLSGGDNASFTRDVGHPLTLAIAAFGEGRYADVVARIETIRAIAHRFGGSHAQRDVVELTLIEAAIRAGLHDKALALTLARESARPTSPLSRLLRGRAESIAARG
ncbi:MAG: tetratricopeptide repeat protein [Rhizobiaceae bacterium]|nr:tetratricopeptide repeat protein [Rhizobiaceae bacterium]